MYIYIYSNYSSNPQNNAEVGQNIRYIYFHHNVSFVCNIIFKKNASY